MATALITGIGGQDGSYLAELLLANGYDVVGLVRSAAPERNENIKAIRDRVTLATGDLADEQSLRRIIETYRPVEIYNLAARASSLQLFTDPVGTGNYNGLSVARLLEAIRNVNPTARFCQASSSELFGKAIVAPQDEGTPFHPRNPYGVAKLFGHWFTVNYRESHGMFAASAILYNHESPRRGPEFVTRKIARAAAKIRCGLQDRLVLGDLEARRDWGYAADYVYAMWRMLQTPEPHDYVLATGESHSVREFCSIAFDRVGLDYLRYVSVDPGTARPKESALLVGNADRARRMLGWKPTVTFNQLVVMMVDAEMLSLRDVTAGL